MTKLRPTIAADLRKATAEMERTGREADKAERAAVRAAETARVPLTRDDILGATHVRFAWGWRKVVRVNRSSVTVETGYSWNDRHPFSKVLEVQAAKA
jgi:hypothetical protein